MRSLHGVFLPNAKRWCPSLHHHLIYIHTTTCYNFSNIITVYPSTREEAYGSLITRSNRCSKHPTECHPCKQTTLLAAPSHCYRRTYSRYRHRPCHPHQPHNPPE